jgi:CMP-N-acetylneuraminic acid synthetase
VAEILLWFVLLFCKEGGVMKTVALIPIKLTNERTPGKNTKTFADGTPLMHFIQRVCLEAESVDETYVYCSDERVRDYIIPGVKFIKRPEYLNGNDICGNRIISEFIKEEIDADIYLETHATAPFTSPRSFDVCVQEVVSGKYDSAFLAMKLQKFLWRDNKPLNFDPLHFPRTQDLPTIWQECSGAYVFSKDVFLKYGRRVGENPYIHEIGAIEAVDIDYPEDFEMANLIYKAFKNGYTTT